MLIRNFQIHHHLSETRVESLKVIRGGYKKMRLNERLMKCQNSGKLAKLFFKVNSDRNFEYLHKFFFMSITEKISVEIDHKHILIETLQNQKETSQNTLVSFH